jgi:type II secretion system protein G
LKGQISTRLTAEMAGRSNSGNAFEQAGNSLGSMLGLALVDRMIDAVVRPEMVMRAMESGKFQPKTDGRKAEESKESAAQADIAVLSQAVRLYRLDHGVCPSEAQGLAILTDPNAGLNGRGAYLGKLPVDPWGRPYQYANPGKGSEEFDITHLPPPKDEQSSPTKRMAWRTERKGFDKIFIYVDPDGAPSKKSEVAFVMRREGFANWRLTEIRLPD